MLVIVFERIEFNGIVVSFILFFVVPSLEFEVFNFVFRLKETVVNCLSCVVVLLKI